MAYSQDYLDYILDQLALFGDVQTKKMFGGVGFFFDGLMFGMLGDDTFRLKVDESNIADYEARDMQPFSSGSKKKGMPYWEVPADVIEDPAALKVWADKSYQAAVKARKQIRLTNFLC